MLMNIGDSFYVLDKHIILKAEKCNKNYKNLNITNTQNQTNYGKNIRLYCKRN